MDGYPIDCYDYQTTFGAKKFPESISQTLNFKNIQPSRSISQNRRHSTNIISNTYCSSYPTSPCMEAETIKTPEVHKLIRRGAQLILLNGLLSFWGLEFIPYICQFWYASILFWPVKVHIKVRKFAAKQPKFAKMGQNTQKIAFFMLQSTMA